AGEVAINHFGLQIALLTSFNEHALEPWTKLHLYQARKFGSVAFATPVQAEERVQIHTRRDIFNADAFEHSRPPERWLGYRKGWLDAGRRRIGIFLLRCFCCRA